MARVVQPLAARKLADAKRKRVSAQKARAHHESAKRAYRAACLAAFESGCTVSLLHETMETSWSAMDKVLKRAKADRHLSKVTVTGEEG